MASRCRSCGYYVEDRWAGGCPLCGEPLSGGGGSGGGRAGESGGGVNRRAGLAVIGLIALVFVGGMVLNRLPARQAPPPPPVRQADSTGRIRVGMAMADVARCLDGEASRRPTAPDSLTAKFPEGMTRSGSLRWSKDRRVLYVDFDRGRVTYVDEEEGEPSSPEEIRVDFDDE